MTNGHLKVDVPEDGKKVVGKKGAGAGAKAGKGGERPEKPPQVATVRDGGGARSKSGRLLTTGKKCK